MKHAVFAPPFNRSRCPAVGSEEGCEAVTIPESLVIVCAGTAAAGLHSCDACLGGEESIQNGDAQVASGFEPRCDIGEEHARLKLSPASIHVLGQDVAHLSLAQDLVPVSGTHCVQFRIVGANPSRRGAVARSDEESHRLHAATTITDSATKASSRQRTQDPQARQGQMRIHWASPLMTLVEMGQWPWGM